MKTEEAIDPKEEAESESETCVSCGDGVNAAARNVTDVPEGCEVSVQEALSLSAGVVKCPGRVCERCYELVTRLQRADQHWRLLRDELVSVCNGGSRFRASRPIVALSRQTQTDDFREPNVKEELNDRVSPSPTHFSDSDDEPLFKTKLNALLDSKIERERAHVKTEDSSDAEEYSCRECSTVFVGKNQAIAHVFPVHGIDPNADENVIVKGNSVWNRKTKSQKKSHKRSSENDDCDLSKKSKLKKSLKSSKKSNKHKDKNILSSKLLKSLNPELIITRVPYSSRVSFSSDNSSNKKNKKENSAPTSKSNILLIKNLKKNSEIKIEEKKPKKMREMLSCPECPSLFNTQTRLDIHIAKHESSRAPFICEICGASYKHKKACDIHVGMHKGISPWKCAECGKIFPSKGALSRHEAIHAGIPNYQCDLCGKSFIHTSSFKMHKLSHSGIKPHTCSKCGLALMTRSHLKRHQRVHSGEKRHECPTCGKKFSERYNLYAHQKSHEYSNNHRQPKNHSCTLCDSTFIRRHLLEKHMQTVHQLISENKHKHPRNTMSKLLKQQKEILPIDASTIKPEVVLNEVIVASQISPEAIQNQSNAISSDNLKRETAVTTTNEVKSNEETSEPQLNISNGAIHSWQLMNYPLSNDYPLRMHGVDYVGYLNRQ